MYSTIRRIISCITEVYKTLKRENFAYRKTFGKVSKCFYKVNEGE